MKDQTKQSKSSLLKFILFALLIGGILLASVMGWIDINRVTDWLTTIKNEPLAPLIFGLVYLAGVVLALPGAVLTLFAGATFGFWTGLLVTVIAANLGCIATFWLSRILGKGMVDRIAKPGKFVDKINGMLDKNGFLVMLYLRMIPAIPFNAINYAMGMTKIRFGTYALGNLVGMLPGTAVYIYLAASVVDIRDRPEGIIIPVLLLALLSVGTWFFQKKTKPAASKEKTETEGVSR